jgi:Flp pilus assembly protein TadD
MNRSRLLRSAPFLLLFGFFLLALVYFLANVSFSPATPRSTDFYKLMNDNVVNGRWMQALYQAESLANRSGWTGELARVAAQSWEQLGDVARAIPYWEIAIKTSPDDVSMVRRLAQADLDFQRWAQARETLRQLVELAPDDNRAYYELGLLEVAFDPHSAGEHLRLAARDLLYRDVAFELLPLLGNGSIDAQSAMQIGLSLASHDLWPYAELAFGQAAALGDPFPEALAYLSLAKDKQNKDGSEPIAQAFELDPDNPQILYLRGLHLRSRYDYDGSLDSFSQAMRLDPTNPAYAAELSTAYRLVEDLSQAEYWLKTAVTLSNNDQRFQDLLAAFYADTQNN